MSDPRVINLARILVHYSTKVKSKDLVAITGQPTATPLIQEVYREVLHQGGYPYVLARSYPLHVPGLEGMDNILGNEANDDQLQHVDLFYKKIMEEFDVLISILSSFNTRSEGSTDPKRIRLRNLAHAEVYKTYMNRSASGELRRVLTLFPTKAYAQDAEMSLAEFEDYVYGATFADVDNPVAEWGAIHDMQQRLIDWLSGKDHVEIKGPNVDMKLSVKGRTFINSDGTGNMPSGEIFTGPVETSVNGWVRFTYPAILRGREVEGIELHFEEGKVTKASAEKNEDYLIRMLDTDPGSRYLGEFAIGTNKLINRFIKNILFDEKIGGTIHMALGAGYPQTGSENESAIHWDMICDMRDGGQIFIDGDLLYEAGDFLI